MKATSENDVLSTILRSLKGVTEKESGGHTARCPGHDDHQNSLSIDVGNDGKILLKCFANCEQRHVIERVCAVAGITPRDLFASHGDTAHGNRHGPHTGTNGHGRLNDLGPIIAEYPYPDRDNVTRCRVTRHAPKTFRPWHRNGSGGWIMGKGV